MERLRVIPGGRSEYAANGAQVIAKIVNPLEKGEKPTGTPRHEIKHAKVLQETGGVVFDATIIPGPGYKGRTRGSGMTGPAMVGPHVTGESGGGFDMFMEELSGNNLASDTAIAKSIIYRNEESIDYVASLLQKRKTMTGGQITEAFNRFDEGERVIVEYRTPDGEVSEAEVEQDSNVIPLFGKSRRQAEAGQIASGEKDLSEGIEVELAQAA